MKWNMINESENNLETQETVEELVGCIHEDIEKYLKEAMSEKPSRTLVLKWQYRLLEDMRYFEHKCGIDTGLHPVMQRK